MNELFPPGWDDPVRIPPAHVFEFSPTSNDEDSRVWIRVAVRPLDLDTSPKFELQAGGVQFVELSATPTSVPGPAATTAGVASVDDDDGNGVYRIEIRLNSLGLMWQLRVTNNTESPADVNAVGADVEDETLRARVSLPNKVEFGSSVASADLFIKVANWGTGILTIDDAPGTLIGGMGSIFELQSRPDQLMPGEVGKLQLKTVAGERRDVEHKLDCTDTIDDKHKIFRVAMKTDDPDDPGNSGGPSACRLDGCPAYDPDARGNCRTPGCGHTADKHRPQ